VAKKKLIEEHSAVFTIPDDSKDAVRWIYKYMQAGERVPEGLETFASLHSGILVVMYTHCKFLGYDSLEKRIFNHLRAKYYQSLPTVEEIERYQTSIPMLYDYSIRLLVNEMARPWTCTYDSYLQLSKTNEAFGKALDDALQKEIASRVKFSEAYYRNTTNRHVIGAIKYVENVPTGRHPYTKSSTSSWEPHQKGNATPGMFNNTRADANGTAGNIPALASKHDQKQASKASTPFNCYKCGGKGHIARNCTAETTAESVMNTGNPDKKTGQRPPPICYVCKSEGHISRNCTQENKAAESVFTDSFAKKTTETRPRPVCFNCNEIGHIARNCTLEKPKSERSKARSKEPFVCYKCGEEGHMARECRKDVSGDENSGGELVNGLRSPYVTANPKARFSRSQRDRQANKIDLSENGESSETADR
jgi:hypothetical protein